MFNTNTETKGRGRIEIERTLIVGNARMSEGTSPAFIHFWKDGDKIGEMVEYWMCACIKKITDYAVVFQIPGKKSMWLAPEQIMEITDKDIPSGIVEDLLEGNIVKVIPWVQDMNHDAKCLREFREYVNSRVSDYWMQYHALNEQDVFSIQPEELKAELMKEFASICADECLGCSCDGCHYAVKDKNLDNGYYRCKKRGVCVNERFWCQDFEPSFERKKYYV